MRTCPGCASEVPDGFAFCGRCGAALDAAPAASVHEERKVVSVLFCDLVGFTATSEAADPEDVRARIRPYHERLRADIEHFGGTVEKFIGDAVMAVFGAPVTHEDDAERAVRSGLRILEGLAELNAADATLGLRVRVGINTGEALVTLGARPELGEGFVAGDVVNTASRIQGAAPIDGVAVSDETRRQTERIFVYEPLPPVELKGKAEPVALFRAVEARSRFGADLIRTHDSPFVGRVSERAMLTSLFDRCVRDSQTQLVTLVGEPGAGKSRLCAELFAHIDDRPELITWRQGRCLPYGDGITFWALGEIVKAHAGVFETDSPEAAAEKLEAALPDVEERPFLRARLLPLLGVDSGVPTTREESFSAWRAFVESLASEGPAVVVFEDLHWADAALVEFIQFLAEWAEGVPLLLVCTARPELLETHSSWASGIRNAHTINLAPLTASETDELVVALLARSVDGAELRQTIVERAGGNPLYAEEFVRLLADRTEGDRSEFPDNVQALIAARLDTLPASRKGLLQDASVVGKVFWAGALAEMAGRRGEEVAGELHELSRKELIRPARVSSMEGETEYAFWHALVRDVAYQQIPRSERARRHEAAAAWIERAAGGRQGDLAEVIAHHYVTALELARSGGTGADADRLVGSAVRWLVLAGERALGLDAAQGEAILATALALVRAGDPKRPELLTRWAEAAIVSAHYREAAAALDEALSAARSADDAEQIADALIQRAEVARILGDASPLELTIEAARVLEGHAGGRVVQTLTQLAREQWLSGAAPAAIETASKVIEMAAALGLPEPAKAKGYRGLARSELGDVAGIDEANDALGILASRGSGRDVAGLMGNLALLRWLIDGPEVGLAVLREATAFSQARNLTYLAQITEGNMVDLLADVGRIDEALEITRRLAAEAKASGDQYGLGDGAGWMAYLLCERGDLDSAQAHALVALEAVQHQESIDLLCGLARVAHVRVQAGDADGARAVLETILKAPGVKDALFYGTRVAMMVRSALAVGDSTLANRVIEGFRPRYPLYVGELAAARAEIALAEGRHADAVDLFADAAGKLNELGSNNERAHVLLGQGRALMQLGRAGAEESLREARGLFESFGFGPRTAEADALLNPSNAIAG